MRSTGLGTALWTLGMLAVTPASAGASIAHRHTPAGTVAARNVLLRRADLGSGWSQQSPAPHKVGFLTCPEFAPSIANVVETGAAASPTFQQSPFGPFVSQTAYVYANAGQEAAVWSKVARPQLNRCLAASFTQNPGSTIKRKQLVALPRLPADAAGYRVSGTLTTSGQTIDIYVDMLVLGHGRTISALVLSSFQQPVGRKLELRLAGTVARRLS